MAVRFLNGEVSDLCLGKPELKWVAASTTISDALTVLKTSGDTYISVWICCGDSGNGSCVCVGKFCMADVILFLCREENVADPFKALEAPVYDILPKGSPIVRHLEPNSRFVWLIFLLFQWFVSYLLLPKALLLIHNIRVPFCLSFVGKFWFLIPNLAFSGWRRPIFRKVI